MANVDGTWMEVPEGLPPSIWTARRCADFIQSRAGSPWFAQYCPTIPHAPYTPTLHSEHLYNGEGWSAPSVNEGNMSDKLGWMRHLPRADAASLQKEFEGKKEELADLDYSGILPILKDVDGTWMEVPEGQPLPSGPRGGARISSNLAQDRPILGGRRRT